MWQAWLNCLDCATGETGRTLTMRHGKHQTATDKEDLTNNIAQHHRKTGHDINWDSATCLTHSTDKDQRLTLESWFTNLQPNPLNSGLRKTFTKRIPHCRRKRRLTLINTWLPPTISQEQLQWRIYWHQPLQTKQTEWWLWTIRDKRPLLQSIWHFADENTDWLWWIRDCRLVSGI